jgi:hypothetical protein
MDSMLYKPPGIREDIGIILVILSLNLGMYHLVKKEVENGQERVGQHNWREECATYTILWKEWRYSSCFKSINDCPLPLYKK